MSVALLPVGVVQELDNTAWNLGPVWQPETATGTGTPGTLYVLLPDGVVASSVNVLTVSGKFQPTETGTDAPTTFNLSDTLIVGQGILSFDEIQINLAPDALSVSITDSSTTTQYRPIRGADFRIRFPRLKTRQRY